MKRIIKTISIIFAICLVTGGVVSKFEKKKGWAGGHKPYGFYEKEVKRALDFGLSLFAIILLWPVMLAIALLVKRRLGSPVLYRQQRPGLGGEVFIIRKYRTMLNGKGSDSRRLTGFGKKLRSTSLDELPELFNIIQGDMSIVGPRPLMVQYLSRYNEHQKHRHDVRPGLTGYAQVSGRNEISWETKFQDDIRYVEKITFLGDLKILAKTMIAVIKKEGINSQTSATMEEFMGNGQ